MNTRIALKWSTPVIIHGDDCVQFHFIIIENTDNNKYYIEFRNHKYEYITYMGDYIGYTKNNLKDEILSIVEKFIEMYINKLESLNLLTSIYTRDMKCFNNLLEEIDTYLFCNLDININKKSITINDSFNKKSKIELSTKYKNITLESNCLHTKYIKLLISTKVFKNDTEYFYKEESLILNIKDFKFIKRIYNKILDMYRKIMSRDFNKEDCDFSSFEEMCIYDYINKIKSSIKNSTK